MTDHQIVALGLIVLLFGEKHGKVWNDHQRQAQLLMGEQPICLGHHVQAGPAMTDLLNPTEQAIAAVVVAVFVGLIVAHMVWIAIKKLQRSQSERQATADMDAKLAAKYECHMNEKQREEMHKQLWPGDRR